MGTRAVLLAGAVLCLGGGFARAAAPLSRPQDSILYKIVHDCLDRAAPGYCSGACPSPLAGACSRSACRETTELFAQNAHFAAIRDIKMCGCPAGFIHALAIPKNPVSGIEDPKRPAGIWAFAWTTALALFPRKDEKTVALAINPPSERSQGQMHVHIVRLDADARSRLADYDPQPAADLKDVWRAARRSAELSGIRGWYGVLVARRGDGPGFWVAADAQSPEKDFTRYSCR
ncbi:MAG: CDP-diacylglycerol diphosphatase [Elusimicrobiota bacterium]